MYVYAYIYCTYICIYVNLVLAHGLGFKLFSTGPQAAPQVSTVLLVYYGEGRRDRMNIWFTMGEDGMLKSEGRWLAVQIP